MWNIAGYGFVNNAAGAGTKSFFFAHLPHGRISHQGCSCRIYKRLCNARTDALAAYHPLFLHVRKHDVVHARAPVLQVRPKPQSMPAGVLSQRGDVFNHAAHPVPSRTRSKTTFMLLGTAVFNHAETFFFFSMRSAKPLIAFVGRCSSSSMSVSWQLVFSEVRPVVGPQKGLYLNNLHGTGDLRI